MSLPITARNFESPAELVSRRTLLPSTLELRKARESTAPGPPKPGSRLLTAITTLRPATAIEPSGAFYSTGSTPSPTNPERSAASWTKARRASIIGHFFACCRPGPEGPVEQRALKRPQTAAAARSAATTVISATSPEGSAEPATTEQPQTVQQGLAHPSCVRPRAST